MTAPRTRRHGHRRRQAALHHVPQRMMPINRALTSDEAVDAVRAFMTFLDQAEYPNPVRVAVRALLGDGGDGLYVPIGPLSLPGVLEDFAAWLGDGHG